MLGLPKRTHLSRNKSRLKGHRNCTYYCRASKLKVIFVATEVAPWSKVGGLGDVLSALPIALAAKGHEVMTVAPRYEFYPDIKDTGFVVPLEGKTSVEGREETPSKSARIFYARQRGVHRVFVDHPVFDRGTVWKAGQPQPPIIYPYSPEGNDEQFEIGCSVLCQSAYLAPTLIWKLNQHSILSSIEMMKEKEVVLTAEMNTFLENLGIEHSNSKWLLSEKRNGYIFVCNDWPCALLPYLLKKMSCLPPSEWKNSGDSGERLHVGLVSQTRDDVALRQSKVVYLVHNFDHTGAGFFQSIKRLELLPTKDSLEPLLEPLDVTKSWLEMGISLSNEVVTVSPAYAQQIASFGSISRSLNSHGLLGVMNGLDTTLWDPKKDLFLDCSYRYGSQDVQEGKHKLKRYLQRKLGLEEDPESPLFGFIGRLDYQKGVDLLVKALLKFLTRSAIDSSLKAQFVLLGCGDPFLEAHLDCIKYWFPCRAVGLGIFNEQLAHEIISASDFLMIPSRSEPCGLVALSALRYGTIPIASTVGGLKEILGNHHSGYPPIGIEISREVELGVGSLDKQACLIVKSIEKALELYRSEAFRKQQRRCMFSDVSWDKPAQQWETILSSLFFNEKKTRID